MARSIIGLEDKDEIRPDYVRVDTRPIGAKVAAALRQSDLATVIFLGLAASCVFWPDASPLIPWAGFVYFVFFSFGRFNEDRPDEDIYLPMRAPIQEQGKLKEFTAVGDPTSGLSDPSGIFNVGYELATGREVWISNAEAREHIWITGTTGSGKTEFLMTIIMNCLSWGSGCIFIDGKGDIATAAKVWRILRLAGRIDDFRLLNFMSNSDMDATAGIAGHTTNPFAYYTQPEIMQIIETMMPTPSGDGAIWQGRAVSMLSGAVSALVWLRDVKGKD